MLFRSRLQDWDDLLANQSESVFNTKSYNDDTPDAYLKAVDEFSHEQEVEKDIRQKHAH